MSRVLVTGMNAYHTRHRPVRGRVVQDQVSPLVEGLRAAGADVDWRRVRLGEDVSRYDRVVVFVSEGETWAPRYVYGALWVLAERPDASIAFNDFAIRRILDSYRNTRGVFRKPDSQFREDGDRLDRYRSRLEPVAALLSGAEVPWPVLVSAFSWGDRSSFDLPRAPRVEYWDPSPFTPMPTFQAVSPALRENRWVLASMQVAGVEAFLDDVRSRSTWDVRWVLGRQGKGWIPESEVVQLYASSTGVLAQPRYNDRSGWWRPRYLHARHVRVPVYPEAWSENPATIEQIEWNPADAFERQVAEWTPWSRDRMVEWVAEAVLDSR